MEKLQEQEGCEALGNLTATDTDGFSLDEVECSEVEEGEETQREEGDQEGSEEQDGWSSIKEVTLKNMSNDEQYDPDTVYGSSFFVPVAGFICRLCNKFYHFESSALHSHCKSMTHFENLKRHRDFLSQKSEAAESSQGSLHAADSLRSLKDITTDCLDGIPLFDDTSSVTDINSMQASVALSPLNRQTGNQQHTQQASQDSTSATSTGSMDQDLGLLSTKEETTAPLDSAAQESLAESREEAEEEVVAADTGKKNSAEKAKTTSKRRSGRAANRR